MAPDSDLGLSYMYSVFNYIPVGSDGQQGSQISADGSLAETQKGLQIYPERDRQLIAVSAVSVVTRLALDLDDDEVGDVAHSPFMHFINFGFADHEVGDIDAPSASASFGARPRDGDCI